jgi:PAS domain S-box-containing protein
MRNARAIRFVIRPKSTRSLLVLFVLSTVIPLVLLVVLPLQMATSALGDQSTEKVADTSSNAADSMGLQLDSLKSLTSSFSKRSDIIAAANARTGSNNTLLRDAMQEFQQANSAIRAALLLDAQGTIVSLEPHSPSAVGQDYSFRDYFTGAVYTSDSYISTVFVSPAARNSQIVAISHRISDNSGRVVGVLVAAVDTKVVFQSYVDRFQADHGVALRIFDQGAQIVAAPGLGEDIQVTRDQHVLAAIAGTPWSGEAERDGRAVLTGYSTVPGSNWVVSATVPQSQAFALIKDLESRVVVTAIILGSVILCAIALLAISMRARDKAESALRSSESRTRTILDTAHQMFVEVDDQARITEWNAEAEHLLGWSHAEAIGRDVIELLIPEAERDFHRTAFKAQIEAGENGENRLSRTVNLHRKATEALLPVEVSSWVTDAEGRRTVNVFLQDISDRLRLQREQELVVKRQKALVEDLRAADKAKSDFISTVSHELRTPLTSITGYLEMLQDGLGGPLNENQQMMIDVVDRNAQRLLNLIEDVLTLSRLESGSVKLDRSRAEVRSMITAAVETLLPQIHNSGLVLEVDVAQNCGSLIGDVNQLERVLINVLNNAVKFTPSGGRLSINAFRQQQSIIISVSDTGVGIPVEEQPHLFSRFFRASTAQTHAVQGTGLGLTIVKSIVERHGGLVTLQSAPGVGTTVYIELPAEVTAEATV